MLLPVALKVPSRIVMHQLMLIGFFVLFCTIGWGAHAGLSFMVGGLCVWLPTRLAARMVFSIFPTPRTFIALFFTGEIIRILLSSILFVLTARMLAVDILPQLAGFVLAPVAFSLSSLIIAGKQS